MINNYISDAMLPEKWNLQYIARILIKYY